MKRSPMKPGTSTLKRSEFKRKTPMRPGSVPMKRASKPMAARSKTNRKQPDLGHKALCHGQPCYLRIPGWCGTWPGATVPAHSNQSIHGKGMAIKADHTYTVPACPACHHAIDQAPTFTRAEKFAFWDVAYMIWKPIRDKMLEQMQCPT